jgi:hypothetical protein
MKAAFSPNKTLDTVDDMTDANIIIAVVNGSEFSARSGLSTVSITKKHPATAIETYRHSKTSEGRKQEKKVA